MYTSGLLSPQNSHGSTRAPRLLPRKCDTGVAELMTTARYLVLMTLLKTVTE